MGKKIQCIGRYTMDGIVLGKGNFAYVELATHGVTKVKVAIKIIDTRKIKDEYVRGNLHREARIMASLRHPNIARLYETLKATTLYCLVTEYANGGELLTFIKSQKDCRLTEGAARPFIRQLISAIHYLHDRNIVHRDLKMENIMLDEKQKNIKLIDFGLSNVYKEEERLKTHCGSPEYAAPELFVVGKTYGPEIDIWSLGIITYAVVLGRLPFFTPYHDEYHRQRMLQQIQKGLSTVHDREMQVLGADCRNLLHQLIEPNPELRIPLTEIEFHPWLTKNGKYPCLPFVAPPRNKNLRNQIVAELAELMEMKKGVVNETVKESRADELSAMFNMMMDRKKKELGLHEHEHSKRSVQTSSKQATGESAAADNSRLRAPTARAAQAAAYKTGTMSRAKPKNLSSSVIGKVLSPRKHKASIDDQQLSVTDKTELDETVVSSVSGLIPSSSPPSSHPSRNRQNTPSSTIHSHPATPSSVLHRQQPNGPTRIPMLISMTTTTQGLRTRQPKLSLTLDLSVTNPGELSKHKNADQVELMARKQEAVSDCSYGIAASSGVAPQMSPGDSKKVINGGDGTSSGKDRRKSSILVKSKGGTARRPSSLQYRLKLNPPPTTSMKLTTVRKQSTTIEEERRRSTSSRTDLHLELSVLRSNEPEKEELKVVAPKATPEDSLIDSCCSTNSADELPFGRFLEEELPPSYASWQRSGVEGQGQTLLRLDDVAVRVDVESDDDSLRIRSRDDVSGGGTAICSHSEKRLLTTKIDDNADDIFVNPTKPRSGLRMEDTVLSPFSSTAAAAAAAADDPVVVVGSSSSTTDRQQSSSCFSSSLQIFNNRSDSIARDVSLKLQEKKTLNAAVAEAGGSLLLLSSSSSANIRHQHEDQRKSLIGDTEDILLKSSSITLCPASFDQLHGSETNETLVDVVESNLRRLLTLSISNSSSSTAAIKASQAAGIRFSPGSPSYDGRHSRFSHNGSHALDVFFSPEEEEASIEDEPLWRPVACMTMRGESPTEQLDPSSPLLLHRPALPTSYFNDAFPFDEEEETERRRSRERRDKANQSIRPSPPLPLRDRHFQKKHVLSGDNYSQISSTFYRLSIKESSASNTKNEGKDSKKDEISSRNNKRQLDDDIKSEISADEQMSLSHGSLRVVEGGNDCHRREFFSQTKSGVGQRICQVSGVLGLPGGHPTDGLVEDQSISTASHDDNRKEESVEKKKIQSTTKRKIPVLRNILSDRRTTGNSLDGATKRNSLERSMKRNSLDGVTKRDSADDAANRNGSPSKKNEVGHYNVDNRNISTWRHGLSRLFQMSRTNISSSSSSASRNSTNNNNLHHSKVASTLTNNEEREGGGNQSRSTTVSVAARSNHRPTTTTMPGETSIGATPPVPHQLVKSETKTMVTMATSVLRSNHCRTIEGDDVIDIKVPLNLLSESEVKLTDADVSQQRQKQQLLEPSNFIQSIETTIKECRAPVSSSSSSSTSSTAKVPECSASGSVLHQKQVSDRLLVGAHGRWSDDRQRPRPEKQENYSTPTTTTSCSLPNKDAKKMLLVSSDGSTPSSSSHVSSSSGRSSTKKTTSTSASAADKSRKT